MKLDAGDSRQWVGRLARRMLAVANNFLPALLLLEIALPLLNSPGGRFP